MWTTAGQYADPGMDYYEQKYNEQILKNLRNKAHALGLELVPISRDMQNTPSSPTLST
jgi:predicted acetyltransferase